MRTRALGVVPALAVLCAGCGQTPSAGPPIKSVATLEEVMHNIVIPHAEVVWDSVGYIITVEGERHIRPGSNDEWLAVESSATILTEAGNLLMMEGRAKDNGAWMSRARALREAADSVRQAAKARDVDAVFVRGGHLFDACQGCHFEYRFEPDPNTIRSH